MEAQVRVFDDATTLAGAAAELFVTASAAAVRDRGRFCVALSGGSTPRAAYSLLAGPPLAQQVAWDRVHVFFCDERYVEPDSPESNYAMVRERLLSRVAIPPGNVHRFRVEAPDSVGAVQDYDAQLADSFALGAGEMPRFDLVLLGMGADGHTASIFPGSPAAAERSRRVLGHFLPEAGLPRLTLTLPVLNAAAHVAFLVAGAEKSSTLRRVLEEQARGAPTAGPDLRLPAARVSPERGELVFFVDRAAAGRR